ncbi:MAG: AAA family ATPase [Evtepia gabavorous]
MQRKVPSAIANITLNRATFTDVLIDGLTFVNFFYGNNGAGKSSIAHAIAEDDGVVWADGKTVDDFDVLVYNQDFINDNFVNYGDLKGVFIFGEEDIEAKKKIAELTNQKKRKWMLIRPRLMSTKEVRRSRICTDAVPGHMLF